jgi:uncharacterized OB-fold protein
LDEKISSEADVRTWTDHIPLQWKYTAGVAGDRFLRLLMQGKIQASYCKNCGKTYLPPKIYCRDCFAQLNEWKEVPEDSGSIYSYTMVPRKSHDESREPDKQVIVLVRFEGVEGGILGRLKTSKDEKPRIGTKVRPVFKPKNARIGDLSDIEYFEKIEEKSKQPS